MSASARNTERLARAVAGRATVAGAVRHAGRGLAAGAGAAVVLIGLDKVGLSLGDWRVLLGAPLAAGALAGVGYAAVRRWSLMRAAGEADRALGLKDRLSTALAVEGDGGFDAWSVEEAELASAGARVRDVVRVRADGWWGVWPAVAAGAAALALFAPSVEWLKRGGPAPPSAAEVERSASQIREVAAALEKSPEVAAAATPEDLKTLRELEAELGSGRSRPEEARAAAAAEVEKIAGKLEDAAAVKERSTQEVQDRLASAAASKPAEGGGSVSGELSRALQRHDLEGAAREAQALQDRLRAMSPAEREELAREMDALADSLEAEAAKAAENARDESGGGAPPAGPPGAEEKPRRGGDLAPDGGTPTPRESEAEARARQEQAQQERERRAQDSAREQLKRLEQSARDAARDIREPDPARGDPRAGENSEQPKASPGERDRAHEGTPERNTTQGGRGAEQRQDQTEPGGKRGEPDRKEGQPQPRDGEPQRGEGQKKNGEGQKPAEPSKQGQPKQGQPSPQGEPSAEGQKSDKGQEPGPGEQKNPGAEPKPGETRGDQQSGEGQKQPAQEGQPKPGAGDQRGSESQPGDRPGATPQSRPGTGERKQPEGSPRGEQPGGRPKPGSEPGDQRQGAKPGDAAKPGGQPEPGAQPGSEGQESPGGAHGGAPDQPPDVKGMERLARQLERAAKDAEQPRLTREQAERARRVGQQLMEKMSSEQREAFQNAMREMRSPPTDGPGGPGTEPARARTASRRTDPGDARTDPVDARRAPRDTPSERVIAEWYSDTPIDRGAKGPAPTPAEALREAAASADRAVEKQEVPARYSDMVRRVFKRYSDRAPAR